MSTARRESRPKCAFAVKLRNARVQGGLMADGSILWRFRMLQPDGTICGDHIRLSGDALVAMVAIAGRLGVVRGGVERVRE